LSIAIKIDGEELTAIYCVLEEQGIIGGIDCIHNAKGLEATACYDHNEVIRMVEACLLE
jgi:hypothetical protein